MANLPQSGQTNSADSLTVTREAFRLQQRDLLEFLAQALGNVTGSYNTQTVDPTAVTLQGAPKLAANAEPSTTDDSLRLVNSRWVRRNALSGGTTAPTNPIRGQAWLDIGADPPALKVWDDSPAPGFWYVLGVTPDATTSLKGLVQLADQAAIDAGTAGRVVDAAQLKASQSSGQFTGLRNRIINGAMTIDQRNAGAAQTITAGAALAYSVDRWYAYCTGANVTGQQVQGASAGQFRYRFTGVASVTGIGFGQRIE